VARWSSDVAAAIYSGLSSDTKHTSALVSLTRAHPGGVLGVLGLATWLLVIGADRLLQHDKG
jgi:hypothetical protein